MSTSSSSSGDSIHLMRRLDACKMKKDLALGHSQHTQPGNDLLIIPGWHLVLLIKLMSLLLNEVLSLTKGCFELRTILARLDAPYFNSLDFLFELRKFHFQLGKCSHRLLLQKITKVRKHETWTAPQQKILTRMLQAEPSPCAPQTDPRCPTQIILGLG